MRERSTFGQLPLAKDTGRPSRCVLGRDHANPCSLPDDELLRGLRDVLKSSRRVEADLIAFIAEVDARRLYALEASPSMHAFCIDVLHLSEPETALRIHVARAIRRHPMLLPMLRDGRLHLSGIAVLAPHLTPKNRQALLKRATHKTRRQIEEIVAELQPRPAAPTGMRKLPAPRADETGRAPLDPRLGAATPTTPHRRGDDVEPSKSHKGGQLEREHRPNDVGGSNSLKEGALGRASGPDDVAAAPASRPRRPATVEPLAPALYQVKFTANQELHDKLERLQALMRTTVPDGDLGTIIDAAVTEKLERLEAKKLAKTKTPRKTLAEADTTPTSRYIPAAVRREVWDRDEGRCTYRDRHGRRCTARERLEFHHHGTPFARGGRHDLGTVRLACKSHMLMAEQDYGRENMARYRRHPPGAGHVSESVVVFAAGDTPVSRGIATAVRRQDFRNATCVVGAYQGWGKFIRRSTSWKRGSEPRDAHVGQDLM